MADTKISGQDSQEEFGSVPEEIERQLHELGEEDLFAVASRARRIAYGRRDPRRQADTEGGQWLTAFRHNCHKCPRCRPSKEAYDRGEGPLEKIHGPYWYLDTYIPYKTVRRTKSGVASGRNRVRYIGRYLPHDLAEQFGLEEGITPEAAGYAE